MTATPSSYPVAVANGRSVASRRGARHRVDRDRARRRRPVTPPLRLRFVMSATDVAALPATAGEVAVVGRSNVGKSSLLNGLGNRKDLAHVSKTPGRTRLLNLYEIEGAGTLVDLPGYGYAAVSAQTRSTWPRMIETYL